MPRRRARRWAAVLLVSLLVACLEGTGPDRFEATPTGWIYFVFAPDADSGRTREVWRVRPTGDSLQRVAEPFPVTDAVRVSPDGRRLVLEVASNLFVLDLDTGAWAPITYSGDRFGAQRHPGLRRAGHRHLRGRVVSLGRLAGLRAGVARRVGGFLAGALGRDRQRPARDRKRPHR